MTAQKGKDLLLKIDTDGGGTYATVAGLRTRHIAFNAETVDISNADSSGRWRELLEAALDGAALTLDGHALVNLAFEFAETRPDPDGITIHGVVRFRAVTEPA